MRKYLFLLWFLPVFAWSAEYSEAEYNTVYEILRATGTDRALQDEFYAVMTSQFEGNEELLELRGVFRKFFEKHVNFETLKKPVAEIYLKHFTREELQQMLKFYRSEAGRKLCRKRGEIARECAKVAESLVQNHIAELQTMLAEQANKKGKK